jgi:hypothetical protein
LRGVVLDAAFDSGETILLLQDERLSYSVPMRRKGEGDDNPRNAVWKLPAGTVKRVEWKTKKTRRQVGTTVSVWRRAGKQKETKVYAFGGWGEREARSQGRRAALARRWYRKRFGIETSYRQMRQGKARTTAKDVRYRLLLVGLALILRQAWAWLTHHLARDLKLLPSAWVAALPLATMLDWLALSLRSKYKEEKVIPLTSPLPELTAS